LSDMSVFGKFVHSKASTPLSNCSEWWWLPYDQLNTAFLPVDRNVGVILIESLQKGVSRPYHKQKLCILLSNMRHFAMELVELGYHVRYISTDGSYVDVLQSITSEVDSIHVCRPAEFALRNELSELVERGAVTFHPHPGWLTKREWFEQAIGTSPPFRMDRFYQRVRKELDVLMEEGSPVGGKYSHDGDNRQPWKGEPTAQTPPVFVCDEIDDEVIALVNKRFSNHPGIARLDVHPTSQHDLRLAIEHAKSVLVHFGPYEDAFSERSRSLFHTKLAAVLNLHRLLPQDLMKMALELDLPLSSKEGYFRQLIWREYVYHIHDITNGFASLEIPTTSNSHRNARWNDEDVEETNHPNALQQVEPLPPVFWGKKSSLRCLDVVVEQVLDEGWTHHIPRLMVLSNIAQLLDINPRELTDWFHVAFVDAYDWVVEPNVFGMGSFALGDSMMTKPYVSGAAYINRMGDSCKSCVFNPKKDCPITRLYWNYFERHKEHFAKNHRLAMTLRTLERRSPEQKELDARVFKATQETLRAGQALAVDFSDFE